MERKNDPTSPFLAPPPKEIPLPKAPLVRVIAQVRFPPDLRLEDLRRIGPFQDKIRSSYPELMIEEGPLHPGPAGPPLPAQKRTTYRFLDPTGKWRASLSHDFLALETKAYGSRSDFLARLHSLLVALQEITKTETIHRTGIRYIDRVREKDLTRIRDILRPEMATELNTFMHTLAQHAIHDVLLSLPGKEGIQLRSRWGFLPPNKTVDPNALEPVPEKSWILDTDAFKNAKIPFNPAKISETMILLAEKSYTFFRWAVTDRFLELYGGTP